MNVDCGMVSPLRCIGVFLSKGRRVLRMVSLIFLRRSWKLGHGWGVSSGGGGYCSLLFCNNGCAEILCQSVMSQIELGRGDLT